MLSLPGRTCIQQDKVSETRPVAIAETIRSVLPLGLRRRPATPWGARGPSRVIRSGLPRPHRPLRGPEVKSRTAAREEPPHHVQPPEPDPEFVTGHPRLCHLQHGRADAQPVSDAEGPLVEAFRREILTERSPGKVGPPEFAPPEGIVFTRVRVDGLRGASVDGRVRLAVADEAGSPDPDTALHRLLEDRRRDFAASPFDGLRQGDVHGDDAYGIRPHGFGPMSAS